MSTAERSSDTAQLVDADAETPVDIAVAQRLAEIASMVDTWNTADWRRRDRMMRERGAGGFADSVPGWWRISPDDVPRLARATARPAVAAAVLSMHPNGRVREAATTFMAHRGGPVPALLIRSTDWVWPVRHRAQRAVREIQARQGATAFQPWLALLAPEGLWVRHAEFLSEIHDVVQRESPATALIVQLRSDDPRVRRVAARMLVARGGAVDALAAGLLNTDPLVTNIIVNGLQPVEVLRPDVLRALEHSTSTVARTRAFLAVRATSPERAHSLALGFLRERSAVIRCLGQRHLVEGGADLPVLYRDMLPADAERAMVGLGEVGGAGDAPLIEPYLAAVDRRVRAAALQAYARLAGSAATPAALAALEDDSPRVAKAASFALVRIGVTPDSVAAAWSAAVRSTATRSSSFRVIRHADRWQQLRAALRAVSSDDADLRDRGLVLFDGCMSSWNRAATAPQVDEAREIDRLLSSAGHVLGSARHELAVTSIRPFISSLGG